MTHVTCRLAAKNWDQLRNPTLSNRVWATFTFFLPYLPIKQLQRRGRQASPNVKSARWRNVTYFTFTDHIFADANILFVFSLLYAIVTSLLLAVITLSVTWFFTSTAPVIHATWRVSTVTAALRSSGLTPPMLAFRWREHWTSPLPTRLPAGEFRPPSTRFLGLHESTSQMHLGWFSHFAGLTVLTDRQT